MPPNNRGQHKPSPPVNNQRRIFRGTGGPTDGNLPPKKTPRVRVKYQHQAASADDNVQLSNNNEDGTDLEEHADVDVNQLSLNDDGNNDRLNNNNHDSASEEEDYNNPLQNEIHHLQKRIQNITLSIQTSPLGISNPNTWRTNCLYPIKNVVKEWRSILSFHSLEIQGGGSEENVSVDVELQQQQGLQSNDNSTKQTELQQLLHETSTKVFILIQMAMQTGPLVGSNPGYFKRCGGEVASVALEFLTHVIGLAGINVAASDDDNGYDNATQSEVGGESSANVDAEQNDDNEVDSPDSDADSNDNDSSSSSSTDGDREGENDNTAIVASETSALSSTPTKQIQVSQTLQSSFLFTEKQSQKVHQWHRNAQRAADTNKAPSKSASKLQDQKSKKQRQKDLKMERKLKKKSKGRGRK